MTHREKLTAEWRRLWIGPVLAFVLVPTLMSIDSQIPLVFALATGLFFFASGMFILQRWLRCHWREPGRNLRWV